MSYDKSEVLQTFVIFTYMIPEDAIAAQDQDTAACASTDSSPFFCEFCKAHLASFHLVCEHFSVHLLEERTREEHTAILEAIALRLQRQREGTGDPDETSNETIGFQEYATFNTIAEEPVQSTTPQDVTNIEIPDVSRLAHGNVRPNKAAGLAGNTLGKEEGQHQGSQLAQAGKEQELSLAR
ncbi:hypothetical protein HPB50_011996 [Hyalomma asiaticum]|uniref:Uncharacterized protein n=1 Tax=Hyalomma asiaticum TaxID=266040 RepID=A0ACB7T7Z5_HYAAI|nr:hypothetical protein HPB50_011996 [Hyalomma asiaticum]